MTFTSVQRSAAASALRKAVEAMVAQEVPAMFHAAAESYITDERIAALANAALAGAEGV